MHAGPVSTGEAYEDPVAAAEADIAAGAAGRAVVRLRALIAAGRGGILSRLALARALTASGDHAGAFETLHETVLLAPNVAAVAVALGETLLAGGQAPAAIAEFQRALRLAPEEGLAHLGLTRGWLAVGEPEKAEAQLARLDAGDGRVAGLAAEAATQRRLARATPGFVRHLFDQFAADYDERMEQRLAYRAPAILRELLALLGGDAEPVAVLDLGCGTGLAGQAFAGIAAPLEGVDLSPAMLGRARARGLYAALHEADIEQFLGATDARFGLLVAADVFVYLGELSGVFAGAARVLSPGGLLLFTVEAHPGEGYVRGETRRWRHSETYLRHTGETAGFEVAGLLACTPRLNAGEPVPGLAVALRASRPRAVSTEHRSTP